MEMSSPDFWIALGQIIMIDILLGGDNAVVIALASRRLPAAFGSKFRTFSLSFSLIAN